MEHRTASYFSLSSFRRRLLVQLEYLFSILSPRGSRDSESTSKRGIQDISKPGDGLELVGINPSSFSKDVLPGVNVLHPS